MLALAKGEIPEPRTQPSLKDLVEEDEEGIDNEIVNDGAETGAAFGGLWIPVGMWILYRLAEGDAQILRRTVSRP